MGSEGGEMGDPFIQLLKKILGFIIALFLIATLIFVVFMVLPGDPLRILPHLVGPDAMEYLRHALGLDKSLPEQYINWMISAFTGQFGTSISFAPREPVGEIMPPYLGKTVILFSVITGISMILGVILGRFVAKMKDSLADKILSRFAAIFFCAPAFLVALIMVSVMASFNPGWPFQGATSDFFTWNQLDIFGQIIDVLAHALIPVSAVIIPSTAMMMLVFRKGAMDQFRDSVPNVPESGDMTKTNQMRAHPFFEPLPKSMPLILMTLTWIMVGVITVEFIMTYKGLGYLLWESLVTIDISLSMAVIFLLLVIVVSACFLVDSVVWIMTLRKEPISSAAATKDQDMKFKDSINLPAPLRQNIAGPSPSLLNTFSRIFSQLLKRPLAAFSLILLIAMLAIAIVGPFIASENPLKLTEINHSDFLQPPSGNHLLGTDYRGRDIMSQMLWGGWPIMVIGIAVLTLAVLIGAIIGAIAGSFIRILDSPIMFFADLLTAIPAFIVVLALEVVLGRVEWIPVIVITLLAAAPISRSVRDALASNHLDRLGNKINNPLGTSRSITRDIIPKALPGMLSSLKFVVVIAILTSTVIDFFGMGDPNIVSWGWVLERALDGAAMVYGYWWWILPPILAIIAVCASLFFVIDALEDISRRMFDESKQKSPTVDPVDPANLPHELAQT
jgi:peptide/nickel transport system permease protein